MSAMATGGEAGAREPLVSMTRAWVSLFTLAWFGIWLAWLVPIQLVLPEQLQNVDPAHDIRDFGIINGAVGVMAILSLPVVGALCDRPAPPSGGAGSGP